MAEEIDYQRLRMDLGLAKNDTTSLPDEDAEAIFVEAGELYSDSGSRNAYARVIAIERLMAQAVTQVDYTQNETQEKSSQIFSHYEDYLDRWQKKLDAAVKLASGSAARFGQTKRTSARPSRMRGW